MSVFTFSDIPIEALAVTTEVESTNGIVTCSGPVSAVVALVVEIITHLPMLHEPHRIGFQRYHRLIRNHIWLHDILVGSV